MHGKAEQIGARMTRPHRRDIDGLRALAILPVLFFHAHVPGFSGGYVGVDIFFVISGYLITGIIARDVDEGRFSLLRFYERRFRRIMPALALMILAVLGLAAWLYLPGDLEGVPKSALAATLFVSNLWFFTDTGYFAGGADVKPLLQTWSLASDRAGGRRVERRVPADHGRARDQPAPARRRRVGRPRRSGSRGRLWPRDGHRLG